MKTYLYNEIPYLRVLGRTKTDAKALPLFWSGSGIEINARATEIWIRYSADYRFYEPWIDVLVSGERTQRMMLMRGTHEICIWRSNEAVTNTLSGEEIPVRTFTILRDTQAMPLDDKMTLQIEALMIEGDLESIREPAVRLEFIGDSITSGEGLCGTLEEMTWNAGCFDIVRSYGYLTAKELGADFHILSQSGWGAYRAFDGNKSAVLPKYYDQTCGVIRGAANRALGAGDSWDHTSFKPTAVVVNLGTNDAGYFTSVGKISIEEERGLQEAVTKFLLHLREVQPDSLLLWCYGILPQPDRALNDAVEQILMRGVQEASEILGDDRIQFLRLPAMREDEFGSRAHPGPKAHERAARFLAEQIRTRCDL